MFFSYGLMIRFDYYKPASYLSVWVSKCYKETTFLPFLAAKIAASLQRFEICAPENPGVKADNFLATKLSSNFGSSLKSLRWS